MPQRNIKFPFPKELQYKGEYAYLNPEVNRIYQELRKEGFCKHRAIEKIKYEVNEAIGKSFLSNLDELFEAMNMKE